MIGEIAKNLGTRLFTTTIRKNVAVKEAQAYRKDIFTYAPKSNASKDYQDLIEEMEGTK